MNNIDKVISITATIHTLSNELYAIAKDEGYFDKDFALVILEGIKHISKRY